MSILIYLESAEGKLKKSSLEAVTYGAELANKLGTTAEAMYIGVKVGDIAEAGKYGAQKVYHVSNPELDIFNIQSYASAIVEVAKKNQCRHIGCPKIIECRRLFATCRRCIASRCSYQCGRIARH